MTGLSNAFHLIAILCTPDLSYCREPVRDPLVFSTLAECEQTSEALRLEAEAENKAAFAECVRPGDRATLDAADWPLSATRKMLSVAKRLPRAIGITHPFREPVGREDVLGGSSASEPRYDGGALSSSRFPSHSANAMQRIRVIGYSGQRQVTVRSYLVPAGGTRSQSRQSLDLQID